MTSPHLTLVINPLDADRPLPIMGDYVVEFSPQVPTGSQMVLTEEAIQAAITQVLMMGAWP